MIIVVERTVTNSTQEQTRKLHALVRLLIDIRGQMVQALTISVRVTVLRVVVYLVGVNENGVETEKPILQYGVFMCVIVMLVAIIIRAALASIV